MILTKRQKEIRKRYTKISKVLGARRVMFVSGVQGFLLSAECENHTDARYYRDQIAIALSNMVERER